MEIPQGSELAKPLDPRKISYTAQAGEVAIVRPREQLLVAGKTRGLAFTEQGGVISAPVEFDGRGQPSIIDFWDAQGRICKTEFVGDRGAIGSEKFTNLYEFDDKGRLIAFKQVIKEKGKAERLFRGDEYQYPEGRPNEQYTLVHTDTKGKVETKTYEDRQRESRKMR